MVFYTGVNELLKLFNENGWMSTGVIDSKEGLTYFKKGHETEYFQLKYDDLDESIFVSVPLKNSVNQYALYFEDFEKATTYVTRIFCDYIDIYIPIV